LKKLKKPKAPAELPEASVPGVMEMETGESMGSEVVQATAMDATDEAGEGFKRRGSLKNAGSQKQWDPNFFYGVQY
jgi:hypothetical protein